MDLAASIQSAIHEISQAMLSPTMIILIVLVGYAVWCIGSILAEALTDRRHYRSDMADALEDIDRARWDELPECIRSCGLLRRQKELLLDLVYRGALGADERLSLARMLMADAEAYYSRIVTRMELVAKIAPMLGLMGTLIPLGPGITAMNEGDLQTLSTALNIAFDTTVVGLVTAVIALAVVRFRRHWYEDYLVRLDAMFTAILAKAQSEFDEPHPGSEQSLGQGDGRSASKAGAAAWAHGAAESAADVSGQGLPAAYVLRAQGAAGSVADAPGRDVPAAYVPLPQGVAESGGAVW